VIDAPKLDEQFSEYGFDATSTEERLAGFHRVENTYLSTFQALGGLGLVLARWDWPLCCCATSSNSAAIGVIVRHRLSAADLSLMVVAENAVLWPEAW